MTSANVAADTIDASITVSGGGLAWTRRVARIGDDAPNSTGGVAGQDGTSAEIWTAVSAGASMTVLADMDNGHTQPGYITDLQVAVITDGASTPTIGNLAHAISASGLPSCNVSVIDNSYVFACRADWSSGGAGTLGSGQTSLANGDNSDYSWTQWRTTSLTSAGTQTMNLTAPSAQAYNIVALEIQTSFAADQTTKPGMLGMFDPCLNPKQWF